MTQRLGRRRLAIEVALVAALYAAYSFVRNRFGSATVPPAEAWANAERVIEWERRLGAFVELDIQRAFIDQIAFVQFWNLYYGLFHFAFTLVAFVWALVRLNPDRYRWWRNVIGSMTLSALVGYASFPLMPPRLVPSCGRFGACVEGSGFVDTVTQIGGIWSFESDAVEAVTNQYAAMPSLHIGWAVWVAALVVRSAPMAWVKALALLHPWATLFGITVTGNHWWLDAVGGVVAFAIGVGIAAVVGRVAGRRKTPRPTAHAAPDATIVNGDGPHAAVFT